MVRVIAYVRPHRLEDVKSAVAAMDVTGMTVSDARGSGSNPEAAVLFAGQEILTSLPFRSKIEVVVPDADADRVVQAIVTAARTGQPGDGKVFVEKLLDAVRVRTRERGDAAV
ncbi:MAG: P-II family nitrogen regulator [Fimbriimonadaceae bacterium]|nr:P-II family nitrogen regulator [Fimbriimonadaceae bacterium]